MISEDEEDDMNEITQPKRPAAPRPSSGVKRPSSKPQTDSGIGGGGPISEKGRQQPAIITPSPRPSVTTANEDEEDEEENLIPKRPIPSIPSRKGTKTPVKQQPAIIRPKVTSTATTSSTAEDEEEEEISGNYKNLKTKSFSNY